MLRQALDFGASIILARLLLPESFGVVAVAAVFVQLSWVVGSLGIGTAVVQASSLNDRDRHTGYWLSAAFGALLTIGFAAAAPLFARWFAAPGLRYALPILAFQFLIAGLSAVPSALLRRELRFGRLVAAETVGSLALATTSITLALFGYELPSLVFGPLAGATATWCALHALAGYWPRFVFARDSAHRLFTFGSVIAVKNLLVFFCRNLDTLIVARSLGTLQTGFYSRAYNYASTFELRVMPVVYDTVFSAYCRVREDRELFRQWYTRTSTVAAVVFAPMILGLMAVAREFTLVVVGAKWLPAVPALRVLCLSSLLLVLQRLSVAAIEASGVLRYEVAAQSLYAVLMVVLPLVLLPWGALGVAWGVVAASALYYLSKAWALRGALGLRPAAYFGAHAPATAAAAVMAVVVAGVLDSALAERLGGELTRLAAGVALGLLVYPAVLLVLSRRHFAMVTDQLLLLRRR